MLNLKKLLASLGATLMLLQGVSAISLNQDRAEAATWRPAVQDLMSRQYPIVEGNQFGSTRFDSTMINWVAKNLDMVVINKSGDLFADNGPNGDIAAKIHAVNPKVKVLQYVNIMDVWQSQASYTWMKNNNAFLYDDAGKVVHPYQSSYGTNRWAGDSTKTNWQNYYAAHLKKQTDGGMDGVFSDNWFRTNSQGWNINGTRFGKLINGWETMGQKSKAAMGSSKILVGNSPAWNAYQSRDITMIESRNQPNSSAFNQFLKDSDTAASYGQATLDTIYWSYDGSIGYMSTYPSILDFSLPACLLTDDIFGIQNNSTIFGIIEKVGKIGYPKGARYRANGILQRDFTAGKVLFNDTSGSVTVTLPSGTYKDVNGNAKNSVTLSSFRGIVLKGINNSTGGGSTTTPTTSVPTAPTGLTASVTKNSSGSNIVNLAWADNSTNETGFTVKQALNSTTYQTVKTLAASTKSTTIDLGASPTAGTYNFQVFATNTGGSSQASNTASVTISSTSTPSDNTSTTPTAPSNLAVASVTKGATSGNYYVNLTWKDNSSNETGFEILQSTDGQNFQVVKTPAVNATAYGVNVGTATGTYYFQTRAVNSTGKSAVSNTVNKTIGSSTGGGTTTPTTPTTDPKPATGAPTAPTNLKSSVTKTPSMTYTVNLSWSDNSSNETGFQILKSSSSSGPFSVVASTGANSTNYEANVGSTLGTYYFQVKAINASGASTASNTVSATASNTGLVPQPPTMKISSVTKGATTGLYYINLAWSQYGYNIDGYELLQSIDSTNNFQVVKKIAAGKYSDAYSVGTSPKGTYYLKLRAYNENGNSTPSNTASKAF